MFGGVLELSGIGAALSSSLSDLGFSLIVQAFVIATLLRVAQGSATVALTTTGGLIAGPAAAANLGDLQLTLLVVAIAAGATVLSHVNDSGFWLVSVSARAARAASGRTRASHAPDAPMMSLTAAT
jgi:GntP family gluconate:H+ symporter